MAGPIVIGLALREDDAAPLALGTAMARLTGAPLALVAAFLHDPMPPVPPNLDVVLLDEARAALEEHAEQLRGEHDVTVHAHRGSPTRVLHQTCETLDAALLVVGSSHRGHVGRVLSGSVTASLLHGAPCAIAVAPRAYGETHAFRRIAVAYDGSDESRDALAAAYGLAGRQRAAVSLYWVTHPPGTLALGSDLERAAKAERLLTQQRGRRDGLHADTHVDDGRARRVTSTGLQSSSAIAGW